MKAALYCRVSTEEQGTSGYPLRQQIEALRRYCDAHDLEVGGEFEDRASGASLDRLGLDALRDAVSAGGVDVVLAQDRDGFSREPAHHYVLGEEFLQHGTSLKALNDHGDDSPEGVLTDGILDQLAKFEATSPRRRTGRRSHPSRNRSQGGATSRPRSMISIPRWTGWRIFGLPCSPWRIPSVGITS
jgi:site-specific DNA recombinase